MATLLIFVFVVSLGFVVAEDTADVSGELASVNVEEPIAVSDVDEPVAVADDDAALAAADDNEDLEATGDEGDDGDETLTSVAIRVDVLDKNPKVGDNVKVKVTVTNWGDVPAENVIAGFSFVDLNENIDGSFKLVDDGGYAVTEVDGGYVIDFGYLDAGESSEVILTFLATEEGQKTIVSLVQADNAIMEPDSYFNTTITVGPKSQAANGADKVSSAAKEMHATGNPLVLLAMALCCIVPCYRRK